MAFIATLTFNLQAHGRLKAKALVKSFTSNVELWAIDEAEEYMHAVAQQRLARQYKNQKELVKAALEYVEKHATITVKATKGEVIKYG